MRRMEDFTLLSLANADFEGLLALAAATCLPAARIVALPFMC